MAEINAKIKVRVGLDSEWKAASQALNLGEIGYATDTHILKVGDGKTLWDKLPLANDETVVFDSKYVSDIAGGGGQWPDPVY